MLQDELNEINNELARYELKIKYESVKLQYCANRNYKLKATLYYSIFLVVLMVIHNLSVKRINSILNEQGVSQNDLERQIIGEFENLEQGDMRGEVIINVKEDTRKQE